MSLINDALIKAERDRAEAAAAAAVRLSPRERAEKRRETRRAQSLPLILLNAAALLVVFAVVVMVVQRNRSDAPSLTSSLTLAHRSAAEPGGVRPAAPQLPTPKASGAALDTPPSVAPAAPPPSPRHPSVDYEFTGMTALGHDVLLSITRRSDRRSLWIPVGKSAAEITAVRYDEQRDQAVIRVRGELITLPLRNGVGEASSAAE